MKAKLLLFFFYSSDYISVVIEVVFTWSEWIEDNRLKTLWNKSRLLTVKRLCIPCTVGMSGKPWKGRRDVRSCVEQLHNAGYRMLVDVQHRERFHG